MKSVFAFAFPALVAAGVTRDHCNADNCLRAVRDTQFPARLDACSSFVVTTVTPATSTHTETVKVTAGVPVVTLSVTGTTVNTVTATSTVKVGLTLTLTTVTQTQTQTVGPPQKRADDNGAVTVVPTAIPAYASACTNAARFSSACSRAGVIGKVTTAPTPVTTVYITETHAPAASTRTLVADTTVIPTTAETASITLTSTASATATATVVLGLCKDVRANGKIYNGGTSGGIAYSEMTEHATQVEADDVGTDRCCTICYRAPGCVFYRRSASSCRVYQATPASSDGVSDMCPRGVTSGWSFVGVNTSPLNPSPLGKGPCFPGNQ